MSSLSIERFYKKVQNLLVLFGVFFSMLAGLFGFFLGHLIALSLLLGVLVAWLPQALFFCFFFKAEQSVLSKFYKGETLKWLLTAGLFAIIYQVSWVLPVWLLSGFILAQLLLNLSLSLCSFAGNRRADYV